MTQKTPTRLPCRGCLPDCPNRQSCNGAPWRADFKGQSKPAAKAPVETRH